MICGKLTQEQYDALIVLKQYISTDEYKNTVKARIERENLIFDKIEKSLKPSQKQMCEKFTI